MWAIIKKEVKSYFLSPIAYVFIGLFLLVCSGCFYLYIFMSNGYADFEYMFGNIISMFVLMIIVSVLTMRMFAEERRNGTEQLLYTSPRSITSIVLGKFIAACIVMLVCELLTLGYLGIISYFGKPDIGMAIISIVGVFLLTITYIAYGMFISSITENQIIAAVLTFVGLIILFFMPEFNDKFLDFSPINAFGNSFLQGMVTYQSLTLFLSFTIMFIILTIIVIQRRKSVK